MKKFNDGTGVQYLKAVQQRYFGGLTQADYEGQTQHATVAGSRPFVDISESEKDICECCRESFPKNDMIATGSGDRVCKSCHKLV